MKNRLYFILFIIFLVGSVKVIGQQPGEIIHKPNGSSYRENIRLITDRDIYVSGERIWFSAILQCNSEDTTGCLSNILYIDLYRGSGPFSLQRKFRISAGRASGSLVIPDDFITGNYYIQVYTSYQKSSLLPDLTRKEILILNPSQKINSPEDDKTITLYFDGGIPVYSFPATGVLVINQAAKILQKAILTNPGKDTICKINKLNDHLGIFTFTPEEKKSYALTVYFDEHDSVLIPAGAFASSGIRINVQHNDAKIAVTVTPHNQQTDIPASFSVRDQQMKLLMQQDITIGNSTVKLELPPGVFATGINYLALTDTAGKLLDMHTFRPQPGKPETVNLTTDKKQYKPGETIKLTISGFNEKSHLVVSAAIDGSSETTDEIFPNDKTREAFRIIHENEILQDRKLVAKLTEKTENISPENLPDIRDVSISGKVNNPATGTPIADAEVYLSVLGDEPQLHIYNTNNDGTFIFSLNNYQGNKKIFAGTQGNVSANILINNDFLPEYHPSVKLLHFKAANNNLYENLFINRQVAKHFQSSRAPKTSIPFVPQPILAQPDYSIELNDFIPLASLEEVFKEIVPNTYLTRKKDSYEFQLKTPGKIKILDNPLVLLDNIPVFDYDQLFEILPSSVERINIINQEYFLGVHKLNGIINVITNKSALENYKFPAGSVFFNYQTLVPDQQV